LGNDIAIFKAYVLRITIQGRLKLEYFPQTLVFEMICHFCLFAVSYKWLNESDQC